MQVHGPAGPFTHAYPTGFSNGAEVEVVHACCDPYGTGYWMYLAPGSGIFLNLGRTIFVKSRLEAIHALNLSKAECMSSTSQWGEFDSNTSWTACMVRMNLRGKAVSVDTIQISSSDMGGGTCTPAFEIIDFRDSFDPIVLQQQLKRKTHLKTMWGKTHQTCHSDQQFFRSGWKGQRSCMCDPHQDVLTCRGVLTK